MVSEPGEGPEGNAVVSGCWLPPPPQAASEAKRKAKPAFNAAFRSREVNTVLRELAGDKRPVASERLKLFI
jgi:hypothetical protein